MPSSYTSLHYHIVFSTKQRAANISPAFRARMHDYMGGVVRSLEGVSESVGGVADHVHLLVSLTPSHCLADFVRDLKKSVTRWVRNEIGIQEFSWQEGYAAFTVGAASCKPVVGYINKQESHHQKISFRDELINLLDRAGVKYDPRYLD